MSVNDYLELEVLRLKRMNDTLEAKMSNRSDTRNESEQIQNNILAMCKIAEVLKN